MIVCITVIYDVTLEGRLLFSRKYSVSQKSIPPPKKKNFLQ